MYTYICMLFQIIFHYRLLQDIEIVYIYLLFSFSGYFPLEFITRN